MGTFARSFAGADFLGISTKAAQPATQVSFVCWVNVTTYGTATTGRTFEWRDAAGLNYQINLFNDGVNNIVDFGAGWSGGNGEWRCPAPSASTDAHIAVTYDSGATTNNPLMYVNGTSQTVTLIGTPVGSFNNTNTGLTLGQRFNGSGNPYTGVQMGWAYFSRILSQAEITALAAGAPPCSLLPAPLSYVPCDLGENPEPDVMGLFGTLALTATTVVAGPSAVSGARCTSPLSIPLQFANKKVGPAVKRYLYRTPYLRPADSATLNNYVLSADAGSYTVTGVAATLIHDYLLNAASGTYTVSGAAATLLVARVLNAGSGVYTVTGADATLLVARLLNASAGSYTVSGADAALLVQRLLSADPGVYTLSGTDATLLANRVLSADAGVYVIVGADATLIYSGGAVIAVQRPRIFGCGGTTFINQ